MIDGSPVNATIFVKSNSKPDPVTNIAATNVTLFSTNMPLLLVNVNL